MFCFCWKAAPNEAYTPLWVGGTLLCHSVRKMLSSPEAGAASRKRYQRQCPLLPKRICSKGPTGSWAEGRSSDFILILRADVCRPEDIWRMFHAVPPAIRGERDSKETFT